MKLRPPPGPALTPTDAGIEKVSNLELFFDLVFVFTITKLTGLVSHPHGVETYWLAGLIFLSLGWIYDGFAWLTSNTRMKDDYQAWMMFAAMIGFFLMSLAIPTVSGSGGVLFALGLIGVTFVHTFLFTRTETSSAQAIYAVAPYNFASALMVLYAAFTPHPWNLWVWTLGILILVLAIFRRSETHFSLSPSHFAERHGLLVIIALGESIMGLGVGAGDLKLTPTLVVYVLMGLLLIAHVWWSYFGPDNERAEQALVSASPAQRVRMALYGFGFGHFMMLFGIILFAAGIEVDIHEPLHVSPASGAWNLAAGLALYFAGDVFFRRTLGIGRGWLRPALAVALLLTGFVGLHVTAFVHLALCLALVMGVILYEDYVLEPALEQREAK